MTLHIPSFLLYLCSWRLSFLLLFNLDNLISAEDATSLQAAIHQIQL